VVLARANTTGNAEQLEQLVIDEIKVIAAEHGGGLADCLIKRALQSPRVATLPQRFRLAAPSYALCPLNGVGFVPIERSPDTERPWHSLLAGARGARS
jgi:hypothetical protein